ncbi:MAG: hypothetical protein OHK0024_21500 [Thalassobaculales bacterium]
MPEFALIAGAARLRLAVLDTPPALAAAKGLRWLPVTRATIGAPQPPWTLPSVEEAEGDGAWVITTTHGWIDGLEPALAAAIDREAEAARLRWITAGSGQALEYQRSIEEARALIAAGGTPDPADYPMLAAEVAALAAVGVSRSLAEVAAEVAGMDGIWQQAGAAIKALRRTAKLRVSAAIAAEDPAAAVAAASGIAWPEPA